MKTLLFLVSIAAYGQSVVNAPAVNLDAIGTTATLQWMSGQTTAVATTLSGAITNVATSITVASATGIAANSVITIEGEHIGVVSVAGNVLTVQRAYNGTTAAAHANAAVVKELKFRTINLLAKQAVINALRQIVLQQRTAAIAAATANTQAESETAVQ